MAAQVHVSSSQEEAQKWLGWHLHSHPFSQDVERKKGDETWRWIRVVADWSYDECQHLWQNQANKWPGFIADSASICCSSSCNSCLINNNTAESLCPVMKCWVLCHAVLVHCCNYSYNECMSDADHVELIQWRTHLHVCIKTVTCCITLVVHML